MNLKRILTSSALLISFGLSAKQITFHEQKEEQEEEATPYFFRSVYYSCKSRDYSCIQLCLQHYLMCELDYGRGTCNMSHGTNNGVNFCKIYSGD